ncbi:MAG: hypothetical protein U0797_09860 [Gemmataceae bacterium]
MRAKDFLDLGRQVVQGATEAQWRAGVIHAYYALLLECRDALARWGRTTQHRDVHRQVRLALLYARDRDLHSIGRALEDLSRHRTHASYDLNPVAQFSSPTKARGWVQDAADALALLDALDADPARRAAAIASLPP